MALADEVYNDSVPLSNEHHLQSFLRVIASLIQSLSSNKRDVAVHFFKALLACPEFRRAVWDTPSFTTG